MAKAKPFQLEIPRPASGKNSQQLVSWGKPCPHCGKKENYSVRKSREAEQDEKAIRRAAIFAAGRGGDEPALFPDEDCTVLFEHHARSDIVTVEVYPVCDRPPGFSGRRSDLHNIPDVLLDALQGVVFTNDNQVRRLAGVRKLD